MISFPPFIPLVKVRHSLTYWSVPIRDAAKRTYEMAFQQYRAGAQMDPEILYRWSKRWLDSEKANATPKEARVALSNHLARMERLKKDQESRTELGTGEPGNLAATEYYFLEAKEFLKK